MKHIHSILIISSIVLLTSSYSPAQSVVIQNKTANITTLDYYAGTTTIRIQKNSYKTLKLNLKMEIYTTENEDMQVYDQLILLRENQEEIVINDLHYFKALIKLQDSGGKVITSKEINDGEWLIQNPSDLFTSGIYQEKRNAQTNCKLIERDIVVVPRLLRSAHITKRIKSNFYAFDELQFHSERLDELLITMECEDGEYQYFLDEIQDGLQTININEITNEFGEHCSLQNLINIHFELIGHDQAKPIKLRHLQFNNSKINIMLHENPSNKNRVYPNPTNGNINIEMSQAGTYRLELFNTKHPVYLKYIEVNGRTQLSLPRLTPGVYTYRISNEDEEWVEKLVVK